METLFERFHTLSGKALELMNKSMKQMQDGYIPEERLCQDITETLAELKESGTAIRDTLIRYVSDGEMLPQNASVYEYEEIWRSSLICRQRAVRNVLEEFLRISSDDPKYMAPLVPLFQSAQSCLDSFAQEPAAVQLPDVSVHRLFLDCLKADLSTDEDLYEQLLDCPAFNGRIVLGLTSDRYYIRSAEPDGHQSPEQKAPSPAECRAECVTVSSDSMPEEQAINEEKPDQAADVPEAEQDQFAAEAPSAAAAAEPQDDSGRNGEDHVQEDEGKEEAGAFIHPRTPLRETKLPSEQKLKELVFSTGTVLAVLMNTLLYHGLMDQESLLNKLNMVKACENRREEHLATLEKLEIKGYVSVYPFEGRNILCFTPLMKSCLRKQSLKSFLVRTFRIRKTDDIYMAARQDMPLEVFMKHLAKADQMDELICRLNEDSESLQLLETSSWDREQGCFILNCKRQGQKELPLEVVSPESFPEIRPQPEKGVIIYAGTLPDVSAEDDAHYCLTPQGLFQWTGGKWTAVTHAEDQQAEHDADTDAAEDTAEKAAEEPAGTGDISKDTDPFPDIPESVLESLELTLEAPDGKEESPEKAPEEEKEPVSGQTDSENQPAADSEEHASTEDEALPAYDEDLSRYDITEGMAPDKIAGKILSYGIAPEHVNVFMCLIEALIENGKQQYTDHDACSMLAQSAALLKSVASCDIIYKDALNRLVFAVDSSIQQHHYSGAELMEVFEGGTELVLEHPVEKLMSVIRALVAPDAAHDYDLNNYAESLFSSYEQTFPGLDLLKPLYNLLLSVKKYNPAGFSAQVLNKMLDKQNEKQIHAGIVEKAKELLTVPAAGNGFIAMPLLMTLCFGHESSLGRCLKCVSEDSISRRSEVERVYRAAFCETAGTEYIQSDAKIKNYFDAQWVNVLKQYQRLQGLNTSQTKKVMGYMHERLDVIGQWLDLTAEGGADRDSLAQLAALKKEILASVDTVMKHLPDFTEYDRTIISAGLEGIRDRLMHARTSRENEFADFLRTGYVLVDEKSLVPIIEETGDAFAPFQTWRNILKHISEPVLSLDETLQRISMKGSIPLYDNIGQAVLICRLTGRDPLPYEEDLDSAVASANKAVDAFKAELEMAFAYGQVSEDEKEDILEELEYGTKVFFEHRYLGTLRFYLDTLRRIIVQAAAARKEQLLEDISQRMKTGAPGPLRDLLVKAREKTEAETHNFVVAEEYINRFDAGKADEIDLSDISGENAFTEFISEPVFNPLYNLCKNNPSNALSGFGVKYVQDSLRRRNVSAQYVDSSSALLSSFPNRPDRVESRTLVTLLNELGFEATGGQRKALNSKGANIVRFEMNVKPDSKDKAEYSHPVDIMGTNLQSPVDVVCLFGRQQPNSIVNTVCNLELGHTAIVLLNGPVDLNGRRQIAEIFHGEKSGQNPFILIDWVLMLHLAMHQKTERLAILLSCTLPYTSSFQPFVAKGSVPDEMFIGRKKELRQILDPNGVSIVYGGRQLGKTALLERAQSLASKPGRSEYAVMLRAADYSAEADVTEESFVKAVVRKLRETGLSLPSAVVTAQGLYDELLTMYNRGAWKRLLLLVDEADAMLQSFKELKPTYRPVIALSDLSRTTKGKFKFVFAGLHNVCRAANDPNTIFGQLGSPLCIKPLSSADALELLSRPLSYLGFKVNPEHLEHILVNTSFYPGIVHYVGYSLVDNLTTRYADYYQASKNNPPYELTDRQLGEIMSSGELNKKIDDRINWTLDADPRYLMLACCIAYLYLNEPEHNKSGHSADMIMVCADMFGIPSVTSLSKHDVIGLLEEMVEMGILVKPTADTFRFRQRRFIDAIGTSDEKIQAKIESRMGS